MAINWDILKTQYLQADRATQLDSLALNLTRIQLLTHSGTDEPVAQHLIRESQFFIEWAVSNMDLATNMTFAAELVDLQRLLSQWKLSWTDLWTSDTSRQEIAALAEQWCDLISRRSSPLAG